MLHMNQDFLNKMKNLDGDLEMQNPKYILDKEPEQNQKFVNLAIVGLIDINRLDMTPLEVFLANFLVDAGLAKWSIHDDFMRK